MMTVGILVGPGRRAFDIAVAREVYEDRSARGLPPVETRILASEPLIELDGVVSIRRTHHLRGSAELDLLVVPGAEDPHAEVSEEECAALVAAAESGAVVASLCTGAFTLAAAGLLDGLPATTHWRYAEELARRYPQVEVRPRDLYCGADRIWTSAGVTAGIDLLLHLVRRDWGAAAAETIARTMVTPVFRPGSQAQYADTVTDPPRGSTVESLHRAVTAELSREWTVAQLARLCAMSPRTFHRWFAELLGTTPITWLHDLRVREAQRLLEETSLPIAEIARRVGYASDDLLRKHFTARLRSTPTRHRAEFRPVRAPAPTSP